MSLALALGLPVVIVASVMARPVWPTRDLTDIDVESLYEGPTDFMNLPRSNYTVGIYDSRGGADLPRRIMIIPGDEPVEPDLLLYASASAPGELSSLPDDSVLLGVLSAVDSLELRLPEAYEARSLVLYSLAHQRIVDSMSFPEDN